MNALPRALADAACAPELRQLIHDSFRGFAGSSMHPCLGARSVIHRGAHDLQVYGELGDRSVAPALCADLERFAETVHPEAMTSFVATFQGPPAMSESRFSTLLWRQLQQVHDHDSARFAWDPTVSADPASAHFSFSVAGRAFFIIGLHPGSSRWARRFAWPTLVFNPHEQFVALRAAGRYDRMKSLIRARDAVLQGVVNPALRDHGTDSEARQYAGDAVSPNWRCPLEVRSA